MREGYLIFISFELLRKEGRALDVCAGSGPDSRGSGIDDVKPRCFSFFHMPVQPVLCIYHSMVPQWLLFFADLSHLRCPVFLALAVDLSSALPDTAVAGPRGSANTARCIPKFPNSIIHYYDQPASTCGLCLHKPSCDSTYLPR